MKKSNHKLCRICGKADAQLIPIFYGDGLIYNLPSKIEKHLFSIHVTEKDDFPQKICYQCTSSLIIWSDLFELSIRVDKNFKNELESTAMSSGPTVDFIDVKVLKKKVSEPIGKKIDKDDIDESITAEIFREIRDFDNFLNHSPASSITTDSDEDQTEDTALENNLIQDETHDDHMDKLSSASDVPEKLNEIETNNPNHAISLKPPSNRNPHPNPNKPKQTSIKVITVNSSDSLSSEVTNSTNTEHIAMNTQLFETSETINGIITELAAIHNIKVSGAESSEPSIAHVSNNENADSPNDPTELKKKRKPKFKDPSLSNLESRVCHICGKFFKGTDTMKIHVRTVHSTERPHICSICNTAFKRKDHLDCHVKYKHGNNSYPKRPPKQRTATAQKRLCVHCGKILSSSHILKEHINSFHSGNRPYKCEQCNLSFSRYSTFYHHTVIRNHKIASFFKTCDICGLDFQSESFYFKHMWKHPENVFCEICNITFDDNDSFRKHIETSHEEEKPFQCSFCGKRFGSKNNLKLHARVHTEEKPYECQYCSWKFHKKGQLVVHIYRHTGERPYVCTICGRGFKQKGDMRKHKAGHIMQLRKNGSNGT